MNNTKERNPTQTKQHTEYRILIFIVFSGSVCCVVLLFLLLLCLCQFFNENCYNIPQREAYQQ